jgi:hypothetical protein
MKRIDHILFNADTDFIAYYEALPVSSGDYDPCDCFARFLADQVLSKKDIRPAIDAIEAIMKEGGWNAEQLRKRFFPVLSSEMKADEASKLLLAESLGPLSKAEWTRLHRIEYFQVI